jgi:ribosomal protein S18 acetylase RimI-like enzyme
MYAIRPYHPSDLVAYYRICLLTGDSGVDATPLYRDPELLGHVYAGPYAVFEPELCFTLTLDGRPCAYVLGVRDTVAFKARLQREWYPTLRARYPLPAPDDTSADASLVRIFYEAPHANPMDEAYPAHLHIDLLPEAQGQGWGRRLIDTLTGRLRALGVPALHLGVGIRNTSAIQFYTRIGFHQIEAHEHWIAFGMQLT